MIHRGITSHASDPWGSTLVRVGEAPLFPTACACDPETAAKGQSRFSGSNRATNAPE